MAKRKGPSTSSRPQTRRRAAKVGSEAKEAQRGVDDNEFDQLRREFRPLERKRAEILGIVQESKARKRQLEKQLRPLRLEEEQLQQNLLPKRPRLNELCNAREAENTQRLLGMLPQEVWEKITDNLENDDLFPLALSCRYFRQKQKELLARSRQSGPWSGQTRLALKTNLKRKVRERQPVSAEYLRFCSKENVPGTYTYSDKRPYSVFEVRLERSCARGRDIYVRALAAYHGHLPLLQELLEQREIGFEKSLEDVAQCAVRGGQLETLQWLNTQEGFKARSDHFYTACKYGHLDIMRWLRSEGCTGSLEAACWDAAKAGQLEVLKWLRSEGCTWDEATCSLAAQGGHLEVLKWLRSEGCPWNVSTCTSAALDGHWDVLRWAVDNGCPYLVDDRTRPALESLGLI